MSRPSRSGPPPTSAAQARARIYAVLGARVPLRGVSRRSGGRANSATGPEFHRGAAEDHPHGVGQLRDHIDVARSAGPRAPASVRVAWLPGAIAQPTGIRNQHLTNLTKNVLIVAENVFGHPSLTDVLMAGGIREVAARSGVSISTVSRVISNGHHVSEDVRQRVMAAVDELGYQPSRVARRMRGRPSQVLGLVIGDIQNPFFTSLARAVEDVASQNGYAVFLCNSDEDVRKEKMYADLLVAEQVAGVVMSPTSETGTTCTRLIESGIPLVTVDRRLLDVPVPWVLVNNEQAAYELTSHLVADGHRRIAGLFGPMTMTTGRERYLGYARALEAHGLPVLPELVRSGPPHQAEGCAFTRELMTGAEPPTALLAGTNLLAMGALLALRELKLRIPDDVGIASFDVVPAMPLLEPQLTRVAMPTYEMGRIAVEILLRLIGGEEAPPQDVILQAPLQLGTSCRAHGPEPERT